MELSATKLLQLAHIAGVSAYRMGQTVLRYPEIAWMVNKEAGKGYFDGAT